jgi:hypothetical protein
MLRRALSFAIGAVAGFLVWTYASSPYHHVLAGAAEPILNVDPHLRGVEVFAMGERIMGRSGGERIYIPHVMIPATELTYNIILFLGLLAWSGRPRPSRVAIAVLILACTHIAGVVLSLEATYAARLGAWSEAQYSAAARHFWTGAEYVYRLAGMFAIAFALWWITINDGRLSSQESDSRS